MKFNELQHNVMYIVKSAPRKSTFNKGDHIWISSATPTSVDCIEDTGWVEIDSFPEGELDSYTFDECYDWYIVTDAEGSTATRITPEWVQQYQMLIDRYNEHCKQ